MSGTTASTAPLPVFVERSLASVPASLSIRCRARVTAFQVKVLASPPPRLTTNLADFRVAR
jgi:hypothetical protein